jgi:hypothetical protein
MTNTPQLPIIKNVTGFTQKSGLTTILFECDLYDGRGILNRDFQINNYELNWYYAALGWNKRYFPFPEFWQNSSQKEKHDFLFILITDSKSAVSMSAKAKVRSELALIKEIESKKHSYQIAS